MKKRVVGLMYITSVICILSIFNNGVQATPLDPTPGQPFESAQWGINIGYIGTWEFSRDNGTGLKVVQEYSFNITGFELFSWNSTDWYVLDAKVGHFYVQNSTFDPFSSARLSFINFTDQYIYNPLTVITFLPLNNSGLMLEWCASALLYPSPYNFILQYLNGSDHIVITTHKSTNNNMIQYVKSTNGDYIKLFFDDKGVLFSMESFYYSNSLEIHVTDYVKRSFPAIPGSTLPPSIPLGNFFILITLLSVCGLTFYVHQRKQITS
jgi:hypothetical protein